MSDKKVVDFNKFRVGKLNETIQKAKTQRSPSVSISRQSRIDLFLDALKDHDIDSIQFICQKYHMMFSIDVNSNMHRVPYVVTLFTDPDHVDPMSNNIHVFVGSGRSLPYAMTDLVDNIDDYFSQIVEDDDEE